MRAYAPLLLLFALAACSPRPEQPSPPADTAAADSSLAEAPAAEAPPPVGAPSAEGAETPPRSAASDPTPTDPPTVTTVRTQDGALATLTFRTEEGVSLSDSQPLVLVVDGETFEAPLDAGPARFTEPGGAVVDQASYTLSAPAHRALLQTSADAVTVRVADGDGYRDYPYVSGDFIE
jgi:hypothetical protein